MVRPCLKRKNTTAPESIPLISEKKNARVENLCCCAVSQGKGMSSIPAQAYPLMAIKVTKIIFQASIVLSPLFINQGDFFGIQ